MSKEFVQELVELATIKRPAMTVMLWDIVYRTSPHNLLDMITNPVAVTLRNRNGYPFARSDVSVAICRPQSNDVGTLRCPVVKERDVIRELDQSSLGSLLAYCCH
jgi:hypothetical protein